MTQESLKAGRNSRSGVNEAATLSQEITSDHEHSSPGSIPSPPQFAQGPTGRGSSADGGLISNHSSISNLTALDLPSSPEKDDDSAPATKGKARSITGDAPLQSGSVTEMPSPQAEVGTQGQTQVALDADEAALLAALLSETDHAEQTRLVAKLQRLRRDGGARSRGASPSSIGSTREQSKTRRKA